MCEGRRERTVSSPARLRIVQPARRPVVGPAAGSGNTLPRVARLAVTFMAVPDSSIVNGTTGAGRVKVESQQAAGAAPSVVHRHRRWLQRRLSGQRPGMLRRVGTVAVARNPDVRSSGDRGRDRTPGSLRGGTREAVRIRVYYTRRVGRGQY